MIEGPVLALDAVLSLLVESLNDTEKARVATNNRLRLMLREPDKPDSDGMCRGLGMAPDHPMATLLTSLVERLASEEETVVKVLVKQLKRHPLHPWIAAHKGVGEKQAARLLGAISDPYWNDLHNRPRTVSELWAYCGLSVIDGEIQRRRKGAKTNWSNAAKMRAYLVVESCVKQRDSACKELQESQFGAHLSDCGCSPYRILYDEAKLSLLDAVHDRECARCGPSKKPALPGSPLPPGHQDGRAKRLVAKELLKDLYNEAKRLHQAA